LFIFTDAEEALNDLAVKIMALLSHKRLQDTASLLGTIETVSLPTYFMLNELS
jgi:hypothetical protein